MVSVPGTVPGTLVLAVSGGLEGVGVVVALIVVSQSVMQSEARGLVPVWDSS